MKKFLLLILSSAMLLTMSGCATIKDGFISLLKKEKEVLEAVGKLSDKPDEEGKYEIIYEMDGDFYWAVASENNDKVNYDLYIYTSQEDFPHFTTLLCSGLHIDGDNEFSPDWTGYGNCIVRCHIGTKEHPLKIQGSMKGWFSYMEKIQTIDLSYIESENVISCANMFMGCSSLIAVEFNDFSTENVTSFSNMFKNCSSLGKLDLSGFDTNKVLDYSGMFKNCSIKELNISGFVLNELTLTEEMFENATITTLIADDPFKTLAENN